MEYSVEIASLDEGMAAEAATHRTTTTQSVEPGQPIRLQGGAIRDALPPESITTYVIGGVSRTGAVRRRVNDNVTGIGDCQFDYHGTWEYAREETPAAPWMAPLEVDYYKGYCDGPYSKDVHTSSTPGDSYLVRFRGTGIAILGATGEEYGMAAISIDDGPETAIDCYSEQRRDSVALYQSPALADGRHTLRVRVTGERNARAGGALIAADEALITTSGIPAASR
ncbi:MAG: hypothetical protein GTO22_03150 [Gemmatimonadales bacterium]|nr:hypothetical protein [Gemmatimonadales bacterium]